MNPYCNKGLYSQALSGDALAQNLLGAHLVTGEFVEKDVAGGFYWYCQAVKQGHVTAKWSLGSMIVKGDEGVIKNVELGMRLINESAEANHSSACSFLAMCYENGLYGKAVDMRLAERWRKQAYSKDTYMEEKENTFSGFIPFIPFIPVKSALAAVTGVSLP